MKGDGAMDHKIFLICAFIYSCSCSLDLDGKYYRPDAEMEAEEDIDAAEFEPDAMDVSEEDPTDEPDVEIEDAGDNETEEDPAEEDAAEDPAEEDPIEEDPATDDPPTGDIDVRTTPVGAQVVLSGSDMCTAPCVIHNVPVGAYTMQLKLTGYYLVELEVDVFASTTTVVDEVLEAVVASCDMASCFWRLEGTSTCYTVTQEYGVVYGLPLGPHYIRGHDLETFYHTNPYTHGNTDGTCSNAWLNERLDGTLVRVYHIQCVISCP